MQFLAKKFLASAARRRMSEKGFVRVGTQVAIPEDEEVVKRHIPVHEQKAVDERGRQRFHGAFTGGFFRRVCPSARDVLRVRSCLGRYFNTVGSKEGM